MEHTISEDLNAKDRFVLFQYIYSKVFVGVGSNPILVIFEFILKDLCFVGPNDQFFSAFHLSSVTILIFSVNIDVS